VGVPRAVAELRPVGGTVMIFFLVAASSAAPSFTADADELWAGSPALEVTVDGTEGVLRVWQSGDLGALRPRANIQGLAIDTLVALAGSEPLPVPPPLLPGGPFGDTDFGAVTWTVQLWESQGTRGQQLVSAARLAPPKVTLPDHDAGEPFSSSPVGEADRRIHAARAGCLSVVWQNDDVPMHLVQSFDAEGQVPTQRMASTRRTPEQLTYTQTSDERTITHTGARRPTETVFRREDARWVARDRAGQVVAETRGDRMVTHAGGDVQWQGDEWVGVAAHLPVKRHVVMAASGLQRLDLQSLFDTSTAWYGPTGRVQARVSDSPFRRTTSWHQWVCGPPEPMAEVDERPGAYLVGGGGWPGNGPALHLTPPRSSGSCWMGVGVDYLQERPAAVHAEGCSDTVRQWLRTVEMPRAAETVWWRARIAGGKATPLPRRVFVDAPAEVAVPDLPADVARPVTCDLTPLLDEDRVVALEMLNACPPALVMTAAEAWVGSTWPSEFLAGTRVPYRTRTLTQRFVPRVGRSRGKALAYPSTVGPAFDSVEWPVRGWVRSTPDRPAVLTVDGEGWPVAIHSIGDLSSGTDVPRSALVTVAGDVRPLTADEDPREMLDGVRFAATGFPRRVLVGEQEEAPSSAIIVPRRKPRMPKGEAQRAVAVVDDGSVWLSRELEDVGWEVHVSGATPWSDAEPVVLALQASHLLQPLQLVVNGAPQPSPGRWRGKEKRPPAGAAVADVVADGTFTSPRPQKWSGPAPRERLPLLPYDEVTPLHSPAPDLSLVPSDMPLPATCKVLATLGPEGRPVVVDNGRWNEDGCSQGLYQASQRLVRSWRFAPLDQNRTTRIPVHWAR